MEEPFREGEDILGVPCGLVKKTVEKVGREGPRMMDPDWTEVDG